MKVSQILEKIAQLDDNEIDLLLQSLNWGMHNEWDCGLDNWVATGFGPAEFRIAVKESVYFASAHEEDK
jgi:hypothetical protein